MNTDRRMSRVEVVPGPRERRRRWTGEQKRQILYIPYIGLLLSSGKVSLSAGDSLPRKESSYGRRVQARAAICVVDERRGIVWRGLWTRIHRPCRPVCSAGDESRR